MESGPSLIGASNAVKELLLVGEGLFNAVDECVLGPRTWQRCVWVLGGLSKAESSGLDKADLGAIPGVEDRRKSWVPLRQGVDVSEIGRAASLVEA